MGYTQAELAEYAHTSTCYIQQIEGMKRFPSPEMLEQIAAALEVDTPELFGVSEQQDEWKERILSTVEAAIQKEMLELKRKKGGQE